MLIRDIFASNLRRLCKTRGSINFVCRQLGMHRQQFALYLRGERLPNKETMARLCRYFKVSEDAFYTDPTAERPVEATECDSVLKRVSASPPAMSEGLYHTYFWAPVLSDDIVGAVTVIKRQDNLLAFRRLTATAERRGPTWSYMKGDHQGVVSERMGWIYFQGSNSIEPRVPTLLAVKWAALSKPLLSGHGMVTSHLGPMVVNVVMTPFAPSMTLLAAIRRVRIFDHNDPNLAIAARFLRQPIVY